MPAPFSTLLRLIQSVPSPKAEPIKLWLAWVGYERIQDMSEAELIFTALAELSTRQIAESVDVIPEGKFQEIAINQKYETGFFYGVLLTKMNDA